MAGSDPGNPHIQEKGGLRMPYKVYCNGKLIAQFLNMIDRDNFLDDCNEKYPDCIFKKKE